MVAFLDPEVNGTASLRVAIEVDGRVAARLKLRGSAGAASLDDFVVQLGSAPQGSLRIVRGDEEGGRPATAALDFLVGGVGGAGAAMLA